MDKLIFPPFLNQGDKVVLLSPSGRIDKSFLEGAKKRLESWGLRVIMGKYAADSSGRFAGTTKKRLSDLQKAMDNPDIKAIFCSRGGYGAIQLIDKLDFTNFRQYPKWLIGYSDITLLHSLFQLNGYISLHAPMARHLTVESEEDVCSKAIHDIITGNIPSYEFGGHKLNKAGEASGTLRGGNLSVLYGLRGTPYGIPTENTILFLEDIGERPYHIDRMMNNLKLGGILENLNGLIVGQFTDYEEDKGLGKEVYELISEIVKPYNYPVCFDFPVGHVTNNYPMICGNTVKLQVTKKKVNLIYTPE